MSFLFAVVLRFLVERVALRGGWWLLSHLTTLVVGMILHRLFS